MRGRGGRQIGMGGGGLEERGATEWRLRESGD